MVYFYKYRGSAELLTPTSTDAVDATTLVPVEMTADVTGDGRVAGCGDLAGNGTMGENGVIGGEVSVAGGGVVVVAGGGAVNVSGDEAVGMAGGRTVGVKEILPTQDEVVKKTEKITRKLQELFLLAQEGKHDRYTLTFYTIPMQLSGCLCMCLHGCVHARLHIHAAQEVVVKKQLNLEAPFLAHLCMFTKEFYLPIFSQIIHVIYH